MQALNNLEVCRVKTGTSNKRQDLSTKLLVELSGMSKTTVQSFYLMSDILTRLIVARSLSGLETKSRSVRDSK